ncbi:hypothetical protein [Nocardioides sp. GXZ039]|uniref:hypothetical protein n=1 Tax=Nocardioides sp. GXZ039 TaxID=3136018 RepID=UPI0030F46CE4
MPDSNDPNHLNDDQLDEILRDGLRRRAEGAQVDPALVDRARDSARPARHRRWIPIAAAAAVVLTVGGGVAWRLAADDTPDPGREAGGPDRSATPADTGTAPQTQWEMRTEYWRGARVDVPADWEWGATPDACGGPPVGKPYVGRPILWTDACSVTGPDQTPTAPYVWFDAAGVRPGESDLGDGWVRESVEVDGVVISVAAKDAALRQAVLDSVGAGDLCAATMDGVPETDPAGLDGSDGRLCAYRSGQLAYAEQIDPSLVKQTAEAVGRAPDAQSCSYHGDETVVLSTRANGAPAVAYDLTCGIASVAGDPIGHRVTEATVPWAGPQYHHLLTGPVLGGAWVYERFIGIQG